MLRLDNKDLAELLIMFRNLDQRMASYTEHPALAIFDDLNPVPQHAGSMNLDDSEDEVELEENAYGEVSHRDMVAGNEEEEECEGGNSQEESQNSRVGVQCLDRELPPPPQFHPLSHDSPEHTRYLTLPAEFPSYNSGKRAQLTPRSFFQLYFSDAEFDTLAKNTNAYAEHKNAGQGGRRWKATTAGEIMIFVGLLIYMGVHKARIGLYWEGSHEFPVHDITRYMSKFRFEQLKRYFHVAPVQATSQSRPSGHWTEKLQPLARNLEKRFQAYMVPGSSVAIDEMMVRFTGRSVHTVMMRAKPIPQGFKMLALCERGYTYAFMFTSRVDKFSDLKDSLYQGPSKQSLSPTSHAVFQLMMSLPYTTHRFILYCDNYFSNIPLFKALREYSIAACGTARPNSSKYPPPLKFNKHTSHLPWNTLSGMVLHDVLAIVWQDKNVVRFLTTYHECTGEDKNFAIRSRRRPRITPNNRDLILAGWGDQAIKEMRIPLLSVNYNDYMGGVDIADQRRSYYNTQLRVCRNWLPLFFWLLDTAIINSFLLAQTYLHHPVPPFHTASPDPLSQSPSSPHSQAAVTIRLASESLYTFPYNSPTTSTNNTYSSTTNTRATVWNNHGFFRTRLAWNLVLEGFRRMNPTSTHAHQINPSATSQSGTQQFFPGVIPQESSKKRGSGTYITKNFELDRRRLIPGSHTLEKAVRSKNLCLFCRFLSKSPHFASVFHDPQGPGGRVHYTGFQCSLCEVPLCKNFCMRSYHDPRFTGEK